MSVKSFCSVMSNTACCIPEKLRKIFEECENLSDVLDTLLKVLGDTSSNDPLLAGTIIDLIQNTCSESTIQSSEIEFTVLSLQNIFHTSSFHLQSKILTVMVTILVIRESSSSQLAADVVSFLLHALEAQSESPPFQLTALDCLLELELNLPGLLTKNLNTFLSVMKNDDLLNHKAAELVCAILKNVEKENSHIDQMEVFQLVCEVLPKTNTLTMASIIRDTLDPNKKYFGSITVLEKVETSLIERYRSSFDLCILRSLTSIQELTNAISKDNSTIISATHPAVSVARNLITLDWLTSVNRLQDNCSDHVQFQPTPFDGADAQLMKVMLLNKLLRHHLRGNETFCRHLDQLVEFAQRTKTSRSLAAVFRVLHNMIYLGFPKNATQIAIDSVVRMGFDNPGSLPHVIDFLKHTNQTEHLSQPIILKLIDSYDEMPGKLIEPHIEHLVNFFIEASFQPYGFCQPRVMLHIIQRCLETKGNRVFGCANNGTAVLELCQALIRNQDYEIFQPELRAVLSSIESLHKDTDVRQRAWMLCALITHVNTESLKDAFDVDMDLSIIGKIENSNTPLIAINILYDNRPNDTYAIAWSLERKRSSRSIYFPLEVSLASNSNSSYSEYIGIRIDFALDVKCGQAESIHIPMLKMGRVKKAFLHLQPEGCTQVTMAVRAVMSTTDGRIFSSVLEDCCIKLEHMLSPISSTKTFDELWTCLVNHCESCCTSTMALPRVEKLLTAAEFGPLRVFQLAEKKATELAMVTADSLLILVRIFSMSQSWHADILVEEATLLPAAYSFLYDYST